MPLAAGVRIVTWNCLGKMQANLGPLLQLQPDVAVMLEAADPTDHGRAELSWRSRATLPGSPKHILVLATAPWTVRPHERESSCPPWALPVRIDGPNPFTLLAVHTFRAPGQPSYAAQIATLIETVVPSLDGPVVVAGDFNTPTDGTVAAHRRNDEAFRARGFADAFLSARATTCADAYARAADECGPAWREPTYYHRHTLSWGFHIDHVYAPSAWLAQPPRVEIGSHAEWVATGRSDHVPVQVDLEIPPGTATSGGERRSG